MWIEVESTQVATPQTQHQTDLVQIWEGLLDHRPIGINDNFFKLYDQSLKATRMTMEIHRQLGMEANLRMLFSHPTIRQLEAVLQESTLAAKASIAVMEDQQHYPLSHAQRRLWVLDQMEDGQISYNIPMVFELHEHVDEEKLQQALTTLVDRHESLRTVFPLVSGSPRQQVLEADQAKVAFDFHDLQGVARAEEMARDLIKVDRESPFNLENGPLLRTALIRIAEDYHVFLLNMHHIISDEWSIDVMFDELRGQVFDGIVITDSLNIQYKDYTLWQLDELDAGRMDEARQFWLKQFSGALPMLELPADYPRPQFYDPAGAIVAAQLSKTALDGLHALSGQTGATLLITLEALIKTVFYRYTGQEDIILGTAVSGRDHADLKDQIGFYVNTLALRTILDPEASFLEPLQQVKEETLQAYDHQQYPFDALEIGRASCRERV